MKYSPAILFVVFLVSYANGQDTKGTFNDKVHEYVNRYVKNGDFSGNILIVKGSKVLFDRSYGKANFELDIPMKSDLKFRIASISKTFTAAAIVSLNDKGLLSYSDKLSKYIPDFEGAENITIRDLLLHRSGVAGIEYDKLALDKLSLPEIVNTIKSKPLLFKPGSQSRYSNSGYLLLAVIIEKSSGITYEKYLAENMFDKLGMRDTGIDHRGKLIPKKATGYGVGAGANGIAEAAWSDIDLATGSGSIYSTTADLLKWLKAFEAKTIVDFAALEYPYGWGKREYFSGKKSIEQSGSLDGYSSYISIYPSEELFVIALSNVSSNFGERSGRDLAAIYFGESYTLPDIRQEMVLTDPGIYTGKYSWPGYKDFMIEQEDGNIYWRFLDEKTGAPLAPISNDAFLLRSFNTKILFKKDSNGVVTSLDFTSGTDVTTCGKIP